MSVLLPILVYVVLVGLCLERIGFAKAWWARVLWGAALAVLLGCFTAQVGWGQPSGSLGPQGPYYYRQGGDRPVRIADGGTDSRSAPAARYALGVPCRTCASDSISANWKLTGSIILPRTYLRDTLAVFTDDVDTTKKLKFQLSSIGTGTTRWATWPNASGTVPLLERTQDWTGAINTFLGSTVIFDGGCVLDHRGVINTYGLTIETGDHLGYINFYPDNGSAGYTVGVPAMDGSMILHKNAQPLGEKTLYTTNTIAARDDRFTIGDNADTTKKIAFEASGITTGTTRTLTAPNASGTLALTTSTLSGGVTNGVLYDNITRAVDANWFMKDDADTTKKFQFQASGITTATTRTYTVPNATTTLAGTSLNNSFTIGQQITASSAGNRCLVLKQAASGSVNPLEVQNSGGGNVATIGPDGSFTTSGPSTFGSISAESLVVMHSADGYVNLYNAGGFQNVLEAGGSSTDALFRLPSVPGKLVAQRDSLNRGGQTASIGSATWSTSPPAGMYQVDYHVSNLSAIAAGTVSLTIAFTDDVGATTRTTSNLSLTTTGRLTDNAPWVIYVASGNITYSTTVTGASGTPNYAVRLRLIPLE